MPLPPRPGIDFLPDDFRVPPRRPLPLAVAVMLFVMVFGLLQAGWTAARGTPLERVGVDLITVQPAAWWVRQLTPQVAARAEGSRIRAPGGGLNVLNGCEGYEVMFLLTAAVAVAPLTARARLRALAVGLPAIWLLNQGRVLALFYAFRHDKEWFALLHGTVAPLVMITVVSAGFALYLTAQRPAGRG